jgi:hypothetical protein
LLNFASEAERSLKFAAELPRFQAAVWNIFNPYEFTGYLAGLKPSARRTGRRLPTLQVKNTAARSTASMPRLSWSFLAV